MKLKNIVNEINGGLIKEVKGDGWEKKKVLFSEWGRKNH